MNTVFLQCGVLPQAGLNPYGKVGCKSHIPYSNEDREDISMISTFQDTTSKIKPIETIYNGYRFRSRLEARWAVFFDAIGLKYEYEKEGYELQTLGYYLPDFYFPTLKTHCEIKPATEIQDEPNYDIVMAVKKCLDFPEELLPILLIIGNPWGYVGRWFGLETCDSGGGHTDFRALIGLLGVDDGDLSFNPEVEYLPAIYIIDDIRDDRNLFIGGFEPVIRTFTKNDIREVGGYRCDHDGNFIEFDRDTKLAVLKSKQARFEHGESP